MLNMEHSTWARRIGTKRIGPKCIGYKTYRRTKCIGGQNVSVDKRYRQQNGSVTHSAANDMSRKLAAINFKQYLHLTKNLACQLFKRTVSQDKEWLPRINFLILPYSAYVRKKG
jgi:hypothetical protein